MRLRLRRLATTDTAHHIFTLALLCLLAYFRTVDVPFYFDDFGYVLNNPLIRDLGNYLHKIPPPPDILEDIYNSFQTRPLSYLTFSLNYLVHGATPAGYHLVNIVIHAVNTMLVYLLITSIFMLAKAKRGMPDNTGEEKRFRTIAFFSAALFAMHPVMTNSVTYVVQRMTSLVTLFYLAAAVMYARHLMPTLPDKKRTGYYLLAFVSGCAAMLTKETAITLPVILVLLDLAYHRDTLSRRVIRLTPLAATMGIIPYLTSGLQHSAVEPSANSIESAINLVNFTGISSWDYFITQQKVVVYYLRLLLVPTGLSLEHDFPLSTLWVEPGVLGAFLLHTLLMGFAGYLIMKHRKGASLTDITYYTAASGIIWFYLTLMVTSTIIPITEPAVEYRLYLPAAGFILSIVSLLYVLCDRFVPQMASSLGFWILATLLVACTLLTFARNEVWRDPETFWRQTINRYPRLGRPYAQLADYYQGKGRPADAVKVYQEAINHIPGLAVLHYELGNAYLAAGQFGEAERELNMAIMMAPDKREAYESLARAKFFRGEFEAAQQLLERSRTVKGRYFQ